MKYFEVLVPSPMVPLLTYKTEMHLEPGDVIKVPFRNRQMEGVVSSSLQEFDEKNHNFIIREVLDKVDGIRFSEKHLKFLKQFANYYFLDEGSCIKLALPSSMVNKKSRTSEEILDACSSNLPELTNSQKEAYEYIKLSRKPALLEGVTGSGKTEVYFHLINDYVNCGKQVLLMLPEIGLATQLIERFKRAFCYDPLIWHSSVSLARKKQYFRKIISGGSCVVIGTRSSLFLPYKNLGLIIVDEEHDGSYKQEENILYNARDAAILRAECEQIKILLTSATPSIETYQNVLSGKYDHAILTSRFNNAKMPDMNIVDMNLQPKNRYISKPLELDIRRSIENNLQSLLFINRRGFAPLYLCRSCGYRSACKSCSSWLVVHKKKNKLICHHCGYEEKIHEICPECSSDGLIASGPGVERVYEEAKALFPLAKICLFTKEEASSEDATNEMIKKIENNDVDIIIGTQIITKGYHFPRISTVGVIDADLAIADIDLKAGERCMQLLQQVGGRSGRGEFEGNVFIQTFSPNNELLKFLISGNIKDFYAKELEGRKIAELPPYWRIVAIIISHDDEMKALNYIKQLRNKAPKTERVKIMGPAPATMSKLKGAHRFRMIVITDKKFNIQKYLHYWLDEICKPQSNLSVRVEIDPYSFY